MASIMIHLAIAKKVKEYFNIKKEKDYYLGAIAPDISKQIGESKEKSHFLINTTDNIPNITLFIKRYPTFKYNSFNLGYYTHLMTDKLWIEEFIPNLIQDNTIKLSNSSILSSTTTEEIENMLYSDYTNLNSQIIDEYEMDLSIFYEEFIPPTTQLQEIPIDQLDILLNKMGIIIQNSKEEKSYTLDFEAIKAFIENTSKEIIKELKRY